MERYKPFFEKQDDITKNPNFKKWFGHSKVVDNSGKPLVVYHGGKDGKFTEFSYDKIDTFTMKTQEGTGFYFTDVEKAAASYGKTRSYFLSISNPLMLTAYSKKIGVDNAIKLFKMGDCSYFFEQYLPFQVLPFGSSLESSGMSVDDMLVKYVGAGLDEVVLKNLKRAYNPTSYDQLCKNIEAVTGFDGVIRESSNLSIYVALFPNQIKSATNNNGEFNKNSHNIYESQDDIKKGDIIKFGKYKNKTATVTGFGTDKNNQPTVITDKGEMSLYHVRIDKLMKEDMILLDEDIKISDLMKASMSTFTRKFNKETNKLMGNPTNHTKLIQAKANKSKDYIDFFWVTERTPKYKDNFNLKVVNPKNWSLHKDNLYTIQLRLEGFFKILDLKSNPNPTDADIESAFWLAGALIWDDTPMFHFQGANFNLSLLSGSLHPTNIPPKYWNRFHHSNQFLSKHGAGVFQSIKFYIPQMRQIVKKYLDRKVKK